MPQSSFLALLGQLHSTFDDPTTRDLPLSVRTPITKALEQMLYQVIDKVRPDTFLEIGAYEAGFSQKMKSTYPETDVIALEANPRVHAHFSEALAKTGVRYIHKAAGAEAGVARFFIPEMIAGTQIPFAGRMGSLREMKLRDSKTVEVEVEVTTLDILAKDLTGQHVCIWMDVEGLVYEVLSGAGQVLARTDIFYCELEAKQVWKDQILAEKVTQTLVDAGFVMIARDCQKWFQHNALFVKPHVLEIPELTTMVKTYAETALQLFSNQQS